MDRVWQGRESLAIFESSLRECSRAGLRLTVQDPYRRVVLAGQPAGAPLWDPQPDSQGHAWPRMDALPGRQRCRYPPSLPPSQTGIHTGDVRGSNCCHVREKTLWIILAMLAPVYLSPLHIKMSFILPSNAEACVPSSLCHRFTTILSQPLVSLAALSLSLSLFLSFEKR